MSDRLTFEEWARALRDGVLLGQRCVECERVAATPTAACGRCGGRAFDEVELPTRGTVHSETTVAVAPEGFDAPYQVAVVDLGETRLLARIDGEVVIGDDVALQDAIGTDDRPAPVFG